MGRSDVKVFILAGGLGTRIRSMFVDRPKSMIPVGGKPFLEIQMQMLADQGFSSFVLCVGYQAHQIIAHFGTGHSRGWHITYSREPEPLGTGGALQYAATYVEGTSILVNGDTWIPTNYNSLVRNHRNYSDGVMTILVSIMEDTRHYGKVRVNKQSRILAFEEKTGEAGTGLVNAGVYIFDQELLKYIPPNKKISLEHDVFPKLLTVGAPLYAVKEKQAFIDIGTPEGYLCLLSMLHTNQYSK
jgi:NDP-sugar pyrophosphorylase family protein